MFTGGNAENLARELLQMNLLHNLFKRNVAEAADDSLVLKGGMAMKAVFGVHRSTKDIDLETYLDSDLEDFRGRINKAIKETLKLGIVTDAVVTTPKMTATTSRWKINGKLVGSSTPIHLTVEVSRRGNTMREYATDFTLKPLKEVGELLDKQINVLSYDERALAFSKMQCLTDEIRVAPRDLYDLHIMIESKIEPPLELLSNLEPGELERQLREVWGKIEIMDWELFRQTVLPTLQPAEAQKFTSEKYAEIQVEVASKLSEWLEQAKELRLKGMGAKNGNGI